MLEPNKNIKRLRHQHSTCIDSFNLLCWNIAKLSKKKKFKEYLRELIDKESLDFLLLQEVKEEVANNMGIEDFSYVLSANMETRRHIYGVMSAFNISCQNHQEILTASKELSFLTRKSSLFTFHSIKNNKELLIVNIHAINFTTSKRFKEELEHIESRLTSFEGALIVAGDFNTWSKKRVAILREFSKNLSLKEVKFQDDKNLKKVFNKALDYVFYKDLHVKSSKIIKTDTLSDHNPICVRFTI